MKKGVVIDHKSRRMFLRSAAGAVVAIPFLDSLWDGPALAQASSPKRFIAISHPNQSSINAFRPTGFLAGTPPASLAPAYQAKIESGTVPYGEVPLSNIIASQGQICRILDPRFNPYANKLALYSGLDMPGRVDHGPATMLGNIAASHRAASLGQPRFVPMKTLDEFLVASPSFRGANASPIPVLRLGERSLSTAVASTVGGNDSARGFGQTGNNALLTLNSDPRLIFNTYLAGGSNGSTEDKADQILAIDQVQIELNSLLSPTSTKISAAERQRLQNFAEQLFEVETSLNQVAPVTGCSAVSPNFSNLGTYSRFSNLGNWVDGTTMIPAFYSHVVKIAALAIKCGVTKVVTIGVNSSLVDGNYAWSHSGEPRNWHLIGAHNYDDEYLYKSQKWIIDNIVFRLMEELNVEEIGGATYLDKTLIQFQSEMSFGHSGQNHSGFLAGLSNVNGLGKWFDYCDWARETRTMSTTNNRPAVPVANPQFKIAPGVPYNRLLVGMAQVLGLAPSDYLNRFGNGSSTFGLWFNDYGTDFENFFQSHTRDYFLDRPLPGMFS